MSIFSVQWKLLRTSIDLPWPSSTVPNEIFLRPRSHATYKYCKIPGFIIIVPFKTDIHWGNPSFCFTHLHFFTTEISIFDANIIYEPTHTQNPHFGWLNHHFSCFNPNFSWVSLRPPAGWTDSTSSCRSAASFCKTCQVRQVWGYKFYGKFGEKMMNWMWVKMEDH